MILRSIFLISISIIGTVFGTYALMSSASADRSWIATSNDYTNMLVTVEFRHRPEAGSRQGLSEYDTRISQPSWADEDQLRQERAAVLEKLKAAAGQQKQNEVTQDLEIIIRKVELEFKEEDFERAHGRAHRGTHGAPTVPSGGRRNLPGQVTEV